MELTKKDFIYEGKAKRLYTTEDPNYVIVEYKDSFTAFNGQKKATMSGKGVLNNKISSKLFQLLADNGVKSHFVKQIDETNQLVKRVNIVPLEVIVRNITTGSLCKRLGVQEGMELPRPLFEKSSTKSRTSRSASMRYSRTTSRSSASSSSTSSSNSAKTCRATSSSPTKFRPTPAASGTSRPATTSTRTASARISATCSAHTKRSGEGYPRNVI